MGHRKPDEIEELMGLLDINRPAIIGQACRFLCGLSGSEEGLNFILSRDVLFEKLLLYCSHQDQTISDPAVKTVINCLQVENGVYYFISCDKNYHCLASLFSFIRNGPERLTKTSIQLIENLSRVSTGANFVFSYMEKKDEKLFDDLLKLFTDNKQPVYYDLALIFGNICQNSSARKLFFDNDGQHFINLLSFLKHENESCRLGMANLVKNCCFQIDHHQWILKDDSIISSVLMPLAGPEEFTEEENDTLPIDLQYLPSDKVREPINEIRLSLVQAIHKLCSTQAGRDALRKYNVYLILRELDKATIENQENERLTIEIHNVIQILIGDDHTSFDNLEKVEIPPDVEQKLNSFET